MIILTAIITALEGKGDELEQALKKLASKVQSDPGVITYIPHRSTEDPSRFLVYEKYEDQEALKYHSSTPHFQEYRQAMDSLYAKRSEISFYHEIM